MTSLAFLGAGAMGEALMRGLIGAQVYAPSEIAAYDTDTTRLQNTAQTLQIRAATSVADLAQDAEVFLIAVKPQTLVSALEPLREIITPAQTVVSIAAGVTTKQIESCFSAQVPVVRVMPNTPALVGKAASAICLGHYANDTDRTRAHRIFDAVGLAVDVDEKLIDAVTGLSGSGPAYVYIFIEALSDAGVRMGLPRDIATQLAAQTVLGSAQMVLETGKHPGVLKDMVTSPGGTTIAGLHALEQNAFRAAVSEAVEAATQRSRELSGS